MSFVTAGRHHAVTDTDGFHSYRDKAALGTHASSDQFKAFQKKLADEDLVGAPMRLKFVKTVGGFVTRL